MAGEFKHKNVGKEIDKIEWEGLAIHEADGAIAGDILIFDGTYWKRLVGNQDYIGSPTKGVKGIYFPNTLIIEQACGLDWLLGFRTKADDAYMRLEASGLQLHGGHILFEEDDGIYTQYDVAGYVAFLGFGSGVLHVKHAAINPNDFGLYNGKLYGALDCNAQVLKDLKNLAASALSGTQKDIEIDIGGTPYYFTVYPTKV